MNKWVLPQVIFFFKKQSYWPTSFFLETTKHSIIQMYLNVFNHLFINKPLGIFVMFPSQTCCNEPSFTGVLVCVNYHIIREILWRGSASKGMFKFCPRDVKEPHGSQTEGMGLGRRGHKCFATGLSQHLLLRLGLGLIRSLLWGPGQRNSLWQPAGG